MKKYWQFAKTWLERHLAYPARMIIWTLTDTVHFVILPFIWLTVYGERQMIQGYSKPQIVTYYIILAFVTVATHSHIVRFIRMDIIKGDLNSYLVRPFKYIVFRFLHELTYHVISIIIAVLIFLFLTLALPNYIFLPNSPVTWLFFIVSLFFSTILAFSIQTILGFATFWTGETYGLQQFVNFLEWVFSGQIAPLIFFPLMIQKVAYYLPFKYLGYFQAQIYLSRITSEEILANFLIVSAWIILLVTFAFFLWIFGLKKYEGSGI